MINDKTESISARLRRVADKKRNPFTFEAICEEFEIAETHGWGDLRSVLSKIADEIDREKRAIYEEQEDSTGDRTSPHHIIKAYAESMGKPMRDRECITDWLNRYYLPRPLFENGEPVFIGSEVDDKKRGKLEVSRICYTDAGFYFNNSRDGSCRRKMKGIIYKHGERVRRSKQQVLDADGVPIEVGDVLYRTTDGIKVTVTRLMKWYFIDDERCALTPSYFTHREPDSQERIDGDALKDMHEYWGCTGTVCSQCPAFVDGKKPKERYGVIFCSDAMRLDLLRRQRELDGRDA